MTSLFKSIAIASTFMATSAFADPGAYLEVTLTITPENRAAAAAVYTEYKTPFLSKIEGAETKMLLVREDDVQVLHGFDFVASATAYLSSDLFTQDVFVALTPYVMAEPEVRIYQAH
jgi:hypothetical protein